jgi:hypothetical protein
VVLKKTEAEKGLKKWLGLETDHSLPFGLRLRN